MTIAKNYGVLDGQTDKPVVINYQQISMGNNTWKSFYYQHSV